MHYILDGYNIIYRLPQFKGESIKNDREKLIKYIYKEKRHLNRKNQISIVFDGKNNFFAQAGSPDSESTPGGIDWQSEHSGIQTLFSHQTNADDYIVEIVKRAEKPSRCGGITVVTDDKELQTRVRMLSAFAIGVDEFFTPNEKETKKEEHKPSLTYKDLEEIKAELVRHGTM